MDAQTLRVWPTPPEEHIYVRQTLKGGDYISTGQFPRRAIGRNGAGRTVDNCTAVTSLFFDVDLLTLADAARQAAGKVLEVRSADRKAHLYKERPEVVHRLKELLYQDIVPCIETAVGLPASLVIDSGWGFHLHYALAPDVGDRKLYLQQIAGALIAEANRLAAEVALGYSPALQLPAAFDATHDVGARLAREPGSMNTKAPGNPRPVVIVTASDTVLDKRKLEQLRGAYFKPGVLPEQLLEEPSVPTVARPRQQAAEDVDFRTMRLSDGRTWQTVVEALAPGERTRVVCPFGGTSVGSGFFHVESDGRARYHSGPQAKTYWNTYQPPQRSGRAQLIRSIDRQGRAGLPLNTAANLLTMLENDDTFDLWYDGFAELEMDGAQPLNDVTWVRVLQHMNTAYDWHWRPGRELVWSTIEQVCKDRTRNPVRDYLKGLSWDGVPRCDRWLIDTFGVPDTDIHRLYGLRWCIGLVARVMEPGCKLDTMLVLTGPQGAGKSTAFRKWSTVPGVGELFSDTRFNLRDKDAYLQIYAAWVFEDAELSGYNAADKEARKGFLSSSTDRFRPPFGRKIRTYKRHTIIVGTTNETDILRDATGDRRYWVVELPQDSNADLAWLETHRADMLAEAVYRYEQGEAWWLTREEEALRETNNRTFRYIDFYTECAELVHMANGGGTSCRITVSQFARAIDERIDVQRQGLHLSRALNRAGFVKQVSRGRTYYYKNTLNAHDHDGLEAITDHSRTLYLAAKNPETA